MSIKEQIREKMYSSLKNHETLNKQIYSLALQAIEKEEKDKRKTLNENESIIILQKEIKAYEETKKFAEKENRENILKECEKGIELLNNFVPKQMTEEEITNFFFKNTADIDLIKKNKGIVMKRMSALKGKADMKTVAIIVDKNLKNN